MAVNIDIQTKNQISHVNFHLGALAGINNGIIENCHVLSGTVKTGVAADYNVTTRFNEYMVGGLCGQNLGQITSSSAKNNVVVEDSCDTWMFVGGLCGQTGDRKENPVDSNKITNSYSSVTITVSSDKQFELYAGQLVGAAYSVTSDCAAYGSLSVNCADTHSTKSDPNNVYIGGFAGALGVKAERIYVKANIDAEGTGNVRAGGIVSYVMYNNAGGTGKIESSYTAGSIVVNTKSASTANNYAAAEIGSAYMLTKSNTCLNKAYYGSLTMHATCNSLNGTTTENGIGASLVTQALFFTTIGFDSNLWSYANGAIKLKIEG